jgi:hypothetical protein
METTPQDPLAAAPPQIAQLPVRLRDLLKREVCLDITRAHIETALRHVQAEADELRKTRPPFLFLHAKPTRSEFQVREANAVETLAALTKGHGQVVAAQPRLRSWVEDDLETFVRDSQPAYLMGLATHRFPDDWQRAILRFDQRVAGFRASLGVVRASLGVVPAGVTLASHAASFERLMPARQWGALLDYEVVFFNRVADTQRRAVDMGNDTLRRQPDTRYGPAVGQWARLDADTVRRMIVEMLAELDASAGAARAAYVAEASLAVGGGVAAARSFVYPLWEALRQLMRIEIRPEEVEAIVAETERMVEAAGG